MEVLDDPMDLDACLPRERYLAKILHCIANPHKGLRNVDLSCLFAEQPIPQQPEEAGIEAQPPLNGAPRPCEQHGSGGRAAGLDRGGATPPEWMSLHQALMQQPGALNGAQPSIAMLRLLMQAQAAAAASVGRDGSSAADALGGGGNPHSSPRNSSGGSGGQNGFPRAFGSAAAPGGSGRSVEASAKGGCDGNGGGSGPAPGDGHLGLRLYSGGATPLDPHFSAQPAKRGSGGGGGGPAVDSRGGGASLPSGGWLSCGSPEGLRAVLAAANGSLNGLGWVGAGVLSGPSSVSEPPAVSGPWLQNVLETHGIDGGGHGVTSALLNMLRRDGLGSDSGSLSRPAAVVPQHQKPQQQQLPLSLQLAASSGAHVAGAGGGSNVLSALLAAHGDEGTGNGSGGGGDGTGLEAFVNLLKMDSGGFKLSGASGAQAAQQAAHLLQLYQQVAQQQQQQHQSSGRHISNGLAGGHCAPSAARTDMLGALPASVLESLGGGDGGVQLSHLLPVALAAGGRFPVGAGGLDGLDDPDVQPPTASAAAAAAAAAAATVAAREVAGSSSGGGSAATTNGRGGGGRPQRHSSSELGGSGSGGGGGGSSKGPTGLQLLKNLVISGAANAGVAGLMNGSGGLADLAVLPGAVATQLMEDLESLGYRVGMGGSLGGGHGRRGSGTSVGGGRRPTDVSAVAARPGGGGAPPGANFRYLPPCASSPGSKTKPNKRPENGNLATQILKRGRHPLAMQVSGSDSGTVGGGSSMSYPAVPPPQQSLLPTAADSAILGPGGAGLSGLLSAGGCMPGLPGLLAGLPSGAAAAALLAATPGGGAGGVNAAALANAVAMARNSGFASALAGLSALSGIEEAVGPGGPVAAGCGGAAAAGVSIAQLRALALAGVPGATTALAVAVSGSQPRGDGLGASFLLGQHIHKGRRSRRTARATGPLKLRNILKDLGIHPAKRGLGDAWRTSDRDCAKGDAGGPAGAAQRSSGASSRADNDAAGNDIGGGGPSAGLAPPPARRQRTMPSTTAVASAREAPVAAAASVREAPVAAAAPPPPPQAPQSGPGLTPKDGMAPGGRSAVDGAAAAAVALLGGGTPLSRLNLELLARSGAAGVPLAAVLAKVLGLQGVKAGPAGDGGAPVAPGSGALPAAPVGEQVAARPDAATAGAANGGGGAAVSSALLATRPPLPTAAPSSAVSAGRGASGGVAAAAQSGKATGSAGSVGKGAATAATGGAGAVVSSKSRRKGGAPSRAAD